MVFDSVFRFLIFCFLRKPFIFLGNDGISRHYLIWTRNTQEIVSWMDYLKNTYKAEKENIS